MFGLPLPNTAWDIVSIFNATGVRASVIRILSSGGRFCDVEARREVGIGCYVETKPFRVLGPITSGARYFVDRDLNTMIVFAGSERKQNTHRHSFVFLL